jgi:hypothetical protein
MDMLPTAILSEFILTFFGTLQTAASILISVIINGEKSRKVVCTIVKIDRSLLPDSTTTYRKTFIFTLAQAVAVYTYVAVLSTYDTWLWKHVAEKTGVWYFIFDLPTHYCEFGNCCSVL